MPSMTKIFTLFDHTLKKYNRTNYARLSDPLSNEEMISYIEKIQVTNDDFKSFYTWKNGFDYMKNPSVDCQIFDFGAPLPLQEMVATIIADKAENHQWNDQFIPLITETTGQYLMFNNCPGDDYGKIHLYSPSLLYVDDPISYYDSIQTMIQTMIVCYENGIVFYNKAEDWLEINFEGYWNLGTQYNPRSDYWKKKQARRE